MIEVQQGLLLVRVLFLACRRLLSHYVPAGPFLSAWVWSDKEHAPLSSIMRALIQPWGPHTMTSSNPHHLPKAPCPNTLWWGAGLQHLVPPAETWFCQAAHSTSLSLPTPTPVLSLPPSPNPISLTPYISSAPLLLTSLLLTSEYGTASYDLPTPWPWNSGYHQTVLKLLNIIWAIYFLSGSRMKW